MADLALLAGISLPMGHLTQLLLSTHNPLPFLCPLGKGASNTFNCQTNDLSNPLSSLILAGLLASEKMRVGMTLKPIPILGLVLRKLLDHISEWVHLSQYRCEIPNGIAAHRSLSPANSLVPLVPTQYKIPNGKVVLLNPDLSRGHTSAKLRSRLLVLPNGKRGAHNSLATTATVVAVKAEVTRSPARMVLSSIGAQCLPPSQSCQIFFDHHSQDNASKWVSLRRVQPSIIPVELQPVTLAPLAMSTIANLLLREHQLLPLAPQLR